MAPGPGSEQPVDLAREHEAVADEQGGGGEADQGGEHGVSFDGDGSMLRVNPGLTLTDTLPLGDVLTSPAPDTYGKFGEAGEAEGPPAYDQPWRMRPWANSRGC